MVVRQRPNVVLCCDFNSGVSLMIRLKSSICRISLAGVFSDRRRTYRVFLDAGIVDRDNCRLVLSALQLFDDWDFSDFIAYFLCSLAYTRLFQANLYWLKNMLYRWEKMLLHCVMREFFYN